MVFLALALLSCQKDELRQLAENTDKGIGRLPVPSAPLEFRASEEGGLIPTILGAKRAANPYHVDTMTHAWNFLYRQNIEKLPATHSYLRFCPQDMAQLELLVDSDIVLFDFPLNYEVEQMGDYYPQEGLDSTAIPCFYTVLPQGAGIPAVPYEVLDELVLAPYSSLLAYAAFRRSGLEHEGLPGMPSEPQSPEMCDPDCPNFLCCLYGHYGCEDEEAPGWCSDITLGCNPWTNPEGWPQCLEDIDDDDGGGLPTNACGCTLPSPRTPGGCIRVRDTRLPTNQPEGVNDAKVIWWDGWLGIKTTQTTEAGCWRIANHRESGKAYMWVQFKNSQTKLRGFIGNTVQIWRGVLPITDYIGQLGGGVYNNINVTYEPWVNQGSNAHRGWAAASTLNALAEFRGQALADGIAAPPYLDIFLASDRGDGFALMKRYLGQARVYAAMELGLLQANFFNFLAWHVLGTANYDLIYPVIPDMMLGVRFQESDVLRSVIYHELAHASHFTNVGPNYWMLLATAEIAADGWGDENSQDAGRIAVCESWAEHVGETYTHRRYLENNSIFGDWERRLETTRNDTTNHVPIGLHHDLIDVANVLDTNACDRTRPPQCGPIVDNVSGFFNGQLFSVLTPQVSNIEVYRDRVINVLLPAVPGNTAQGIDDLFNSY